MAEGYRYGAVLGGILLGAKLKEKDTAFLDKLFKKLRVEVVEQETVDKIVNIIKDTLPL